MITSRFLSKKADWVSPSVEKTHQDKHAPEMKLSPAEYSEMAELMNKLKKRLGARINNVRTKDNGKQTIGYSIDGYRLVTTPLDKIVSLYYTGHG